MNILDALSVFAPVSPEAIKEAKEKLLPKHHLHDVKFDTGKAMYSPGHEAILGSMYLTEHDGSKPRVYKTEAAVLADLKSGKISENTPVIIK